MKKIALAMVLIVVCSGCASGKTRRATEEDNKISAAYQTKMDDGKTTSDNDKDFIRAMRRAFLELDRDVRGTTKADASRAQAIKAAQLGVSPAAVPNL